MKKFAALTLSALLFFSTTSLAENDGLVVNLEDEICGSVEGQWIPGRLTRKGSFSSFASQLKTTRSRIKKLKKRKRLTKTLRMRKKLKKLRQRIKKSQCAVLTGQEQPESPTVAPTIPENPIPTSTPTPTSIPTLTPTSSPSPTSTPTPTSIPGGGTSFSNHRLQAMVDSNMAIINDNVYDAMTACFLWLAGDMVEFIEGSALGSCVTARIYNITRDETCDFWCETTYDHKITSINDSSFVVNDVVFETWTGCFGMSEGDTLISLDGRVDNFCLFHEFYNTRTDRICKATCP